MAITVEGAASSGFAYIVNQNRHPIEKSIRQFPIGGCDKSSGEPAETAKNELLEGTGVIAGKVEYPGSFYADPGFTNQEIHVCAANNILVVCEHKIEKSEYGLTYKKQRYPVSFH